MPSVRFAETSAPPLSTWDELVARQHKRWEIKAKSPFQDSGKRNTSFGLPRTTTAHVLHVFPSCAAAASWAELRASISQKRPVTPPTVKRLLDTTQKASPRTVGWVRQQPQFPSPRPSTTALSSRATRNPELPFKVSTVLDRKQTTAYLYHDGIPGTAMTYFSVK